LLDSKEQCEWICDWYFRRWVCGWELQSLS
jgi:hypothetical protein